MIRNPSGTTRNPLETHLRLDLHIVLGRIYYGQEFFDPHTIQGHL